MIAVFKYPFRAVDTQTLKMHEGAVILSAAMQRNTACVWARVDTSKPLVERIIHVLGTGHDVGGRKLGHFIGTVLMADGDLVFHVFEDAPLP